MATKHISDVQVVWAYYMRWKIFEALRKRDIWYDKLPYDILEEITGECQKVCYRAMERAYDRGYIEFGTSLRTGWLTPKGEQLLNEAA